MNVDKIASSPQVLVRTTPHNLAHLPPAQDVISLHFTGQKQDTENTRTRFWIGLGKALLWPFRKIRDLFQAGIRWLRGNRQTEMAEDLTNPPTKAFAGKLHGVTDSILEQLSQITNQLGDKTVSTKITKMRHWLGQYHEYINALPEGAETFRDVPPEVRRKYRQLIFDALSSDIDLLVNWGKSEARRLGYPEENIQKIIVMGKVNKP